MSCLPCYRVLLSSVAATSLASCGVTEPTPTSGCHSLTDCDFGQVCDVPSGNCMPEPVDRFVGSFACAVDDDTTNFNESVLGASEVIGTLAGRRYALHHSAGCKLTVMKGNDPDTGAPVDIVVLLVNVLALNGSDELTAWLLWQDIEAGGRVDIPVATVMSSAFLESTVTLYRGSPPAAHGHAAQGSVYLASQPQVGYLLRGYFDVALNASVEQEARYGVPCPRGNADCGTNDAEVYCVDLKFEGDPEAHFVCSKHCSSDADCVLDNGLCVGGGWCGRPCMSSSECEDPLRCAAGPDPQAAGGCL